MLRTLKLEAKQRLLQEAQMAVDQGQYRLAGEMFARFLKNYPDSPRQTEAEWWLAYSYQQAGALRLALQHYHRLRDSDEKGPYQADAKRKIVALRKLFGHARGSLEPVNGILVSHEQLSGVAARDAWLTTEAQAGMTTIVVDVGCPELARTNPGEAQAVFWQDKWSWLIRNVFSPLVSKRHQHGLSIFAAVTLRCMGMNRSQSDGRDRVYDPATQSLVPSRLFDLFHPEYQEYVLHRLAELAGSGIDGLVFRSDHPSGPFDGFSPLALQAFKRDFAIDLIPTKLYAANLQDGDSSRGGRATHRVKLVETAAPVFWKWVGWKARERIRILEQVMRSLQKRSPTLQFGLELHRECVTDPVKALVHYGEDLLEAKERGFDFFLIRPDPKQNPASTIGNKAGSLVDRVEKLFEDPSQIWMGASLQQPLDFWREGRPLSRTTDAWHPNNTAKIYYVHVMP